MWIEDVFGWTKAQAGLAEVTVRFLSKVEAVFTLVRPPKLLAEALA